MILSYLFTMLTKTLTADISQTLIMSKCISALVATFGAPNSEVANVAMIGFLELDKSGNVLCLILVEKTLMCF
jgi:hypothetical protein